MSISESFVVADNGNGIDSEVVLPGHGMFRILNTQ